MGRPRIPDAERKVICMVRLEPWMNDWLKQRATAQGTSKTRVIRHAICELMKREYGA